MTMETKMMIGLTAVLVILTGVYAFLTYRIMSANQNAVNAMRDQIIASVRPYVYFDLIPHGAIIEGVIKNTGVTAAYKVAVRLQPGVKVHVRGLSSDSCLVGKLIPFLPPAKEIREFLGSFSEMENENTSLSYSGEMTYTDAEGRSYCEKFAIDIGSQKNMPYIGCSTVEDELKKLNEKLASLVTAVGKK